MKYEMDKNINQYWLNTGPWYNTAICLRLHGSLFGVFIKHTISDRYNLLCTLVKLDKIQPADEDNEIRIINRSIPKTTTIEALVSLFSTFNFIDT